MGFDLIIFAFTCAALLRNSSRSGLWHLLFRDGLIYWIVTFSVNAIPAVSPRPRMSKHVSIRSAHLYLGP